MTKLHKLILIVVLFLGCGKLFAQNLPSGKAYILHEGSMSKRGSVGYLQLPAKTYQHIDSVASFGNQLLLVGAKLVLTDGVGNIRIYDTTTQSLSISIGAGARSVAAFGASQLLVASNVAPYFRVVDMATGNTVYSLDTNKVKTAREGVWVEGTTAYLTGFLNANDLVRVNLATQDTLAHIHTAINNNWMAAIGGVLYVGCPDYISNRTIIHGIANGAVVNTDTLIGTAWTAAFACGNELVMKGFGVNAMRYDVTTKMQTSVAGTFSAYAVIPYCALPSTYFYTVTDFSSTGYVGILSGANRDSVATHISPRAVVFVPNTQVGISEDALSTLRVYPNPTAGELHIEMPSAGVATLYTLQGAVVLTQQVQSTDVLQLGMLPAGMYLLAVTDAAGTSRSVLKITVE